MSVNAVNSDGSLLRVAGGTLYADLAVGSIVPFGGSAIPSGYLLCNGQAVSRTTYAELFAVIGTAFGTGDGSTTFNVPDLREATTKGVGRGVKGSQHYDNDGIALGEFVDDRIKMHTHNVYVRDTGHYHGTDSGSSLPSPNNLGITKNAGGAGWVANPVAGTASNTQVVSANIQVSSTVNFGNIDNATAAKGYATNEVKAVGVNYIIKAKQVAVPADFKEAIDDAIKSELTPSIVLRTSPISRGYAVFYLPKGVTAAKAVLLDILGYTLVTGSCNLVHYTQFSSEAWYVTTASLNTGFNTNLIDGDAIIIKIELTY